MMDFLTQGNLAWAPMDAHYDRFFIGDNVYDAVAGREAFRDNLVGYFPREAAAIDRYLELLSEVSRGMRTFTLDRTLPPWAAAVAGPLLRRRLPTSFDRTTWEVLSELTDDPELIAVLTGQWGDMGLPPKRSSFVIQALIAQPLPARRLLPGGRRVAHRRDDPAAHPRDAAARCSPTRASTEILVRDGRARGVRMADGHEIECALRDLGCRRDQHLRTAAAGGRVAHARLRRAAAEGEAEHRPPRRVHRPAGHRRRARPAEDQLLDLPEQRLRRHARPQFEADPTGRFPVVYLSFPSAKDPDFERRHPGRATIEIVAPAPYEIFAPWAGKTWGKRGDDYEALKDAYGERLLEHLYDKVPQVRGRVDYWEVSTPLSMQWFCGWERGELYGLDHDPSRMQQRWLRPRTRVPGLWLTGQDIMSCGVTGAMMGGVAAATSVAGLRRMTPVMKRIFG